MRIIPKRLKWLGFGAAIGWLFDAEHGKERRAWITDQTAGLLRGAGRGLESVSPSVGAKFRQLGDAVDPDGRDDADRPVSLAAPSNPSPSKPSGAIATG